MYGLNELARQHVGFPHSNLIFVTDSNGEVIAAFVKGTVSQDTIKDLAVKHNCIIEDQTGIVFDPDPDANQGWFPSTNG